MAKKTTAYLFMCGDEHDKKCTLWRFVKTAADKLSTKCTCTSLGRLAKVPVADKELVKQGRTALKVIKWEAGRGVDLDADRYLVPIMENGNLVEWKTKRELPEDMECIE